MPTFSKSEKLKRKNLIDRLFAEGEMLKQYPFLMRFLKLPAAELDKVQIAISVPKRNIKKAVDRNRLRRQLKEIYRLNKSDLLSKFENKESGLALFLIYTGKGDESYPQLEKKLNLILKKLEAQL